MMVHLRAVASFGRMNMRTNTLFVAAASLLIAVPAMTTAIGQQTNEEERTTAAEVVAKYLEAIGGIESLKNIETKKIRYSVHMFGRDEYLMERSWTRPNAMQTGPPGSSTYMLTEGNRSWQVGPEGRTELPPALCADLAKQADIDGPLIDWASKGISLDYLGTEFYDLSDLHRVMLTFEDGVQWELYFDSSTGYLRKMKQPTYLMLNDEIRRGPDATYYYFDYRSVDGIMFPHLWLQISEDHAHAFTVLEMELNRSQGRRERVRGGRQKPTTSKPGTPARQGSSHSFLGALRCYRSPPALASISGGRRAGGRKLSAPPDTSSFR
jgi:hypothetical protein